MATIPKPTTAKILGENWQNWRPQKLEFCWISTHLTPLGEGLEGLGSGDFRQVTASWPERAVVTRPPGSLEMLQEWSFKVQNMRKWWLVGGAITILKNMSSSMGKMTSHIWNGKWKMFQTTNQVKTVNDLMEFGWPTVTETVSSSSLILQLTYGWLFQAEATKATFLPCKVWSDMKLGTYFLWRLTWAFKIFSQHTSTTQLIRIDSD